MQKLVWQNANGDLIDLTSGNYGITQWEGFSNTSLNIQSQQVPFQDGAVFLDALLNQRELSVTLKMQDNGNLEERYRMRRELIHILNPKLGEGYLIYTNDFISKRIKCVAQVPLFETHNSDTRGTPKASLSWTATNPYWEDLEETIVKLEGHGELVINNQGDVKINCQIEHFAVNGSNNSLNIINPTNKESIIINNIGSDLPLLVDTTSGNKKVVAENYEVKSAFKMPVGMCENANGEIIIINTGMFYKYSDFINYETIPQKENKGITGMVYFNGYYYGAYLSYSNKMLYKSTDLKTWENVFQNNLTVDKLKVVDNKLFILSGNNIIYSADGTNFTTTTINSTNRIVDIIKVGSDYIALESYNYIYKSTNLSSWTRYSTNNADDKFQSYICYFKNNYVILYSDSSGIHLSVSTNLSSWTIKNLPITYGFVTTDGNILIGFSPSEKKLSSTTDLDNWSTLQLDYPVYYLYYSDKYKTFIGSDTNNIVTTNAKTCYVYGAKNDINLTTSIISEFKVCENILLMKAEYGDKRYIIKQKNDGLEIYNISSSSSDPQITDFYIKDNNFLFIDSYYVYKINSATEYEIIKTFENTLRSIFYSKILNAWLVLTTNGLIYKSTDLVNWTQLNITNVNGICESDTDFYFVEKQSGSLVKVKKTSDFVNFEDLYSYSNINAEGLQKIKYKNNKLIIYGYFIILTGDLSNNYWDSYDNGISDSWRDVAIFRDSFILVDFYGHIFILQNGQLLNYGRPIERYLLTIEEYENRIYIGGTIYGFLKSITENKISMLDKSSNMGFGFEVGTNYIVTNGEGLTTILYRQKYLGV